MPPQGRCCLRLGLVTISAMDMHRNTARSPSKKRFSAPAVRSSRRCPTSRSSRSDRSCHQRQTEHAQPIPTRLLRCALERPPAPDVGTPPLCGKRVAAIALRITDGDREARREPGPCTGRKCLPALSPFSKKNYSHSLPPGTAEGEHQLLYLNSGSAFSASLVAPGSTIFLSCICSEPKGTTTYFVP